MSDRALRWAVAGVAAALVVGLATTRSLACRADGRDTDRTDLWTRAGRDTLSGFGNMYNLRVIDTPERPYRYRGWFFGWAVKDCNRQIPGYEGCDAIFAARAQFLDGPWEVYCGGGRWDSLRRATMWRPVFAPQKEPYDSWHNGDPSVVRVGSRYYMAYSSVGHNADGIPYLGKGDKDGSLLCIMGAVSTDGLNWKRSSAPILINRADIGAPPTPQGEAHLLGSYHRPSLLYENGRFRLWFDYWAGADKGVSMGYAECSGDFLSPASWVIKRAGMNPCLRQFPNPNVVRVGKRLHAFGDPPQGGPHPWTARKITEAVSEDGLTWRVLGYVRPLEDGAALHVPEAFVETRRDGYRVHVFYGCQVGGEPYDYRYNRIRRMWRDVGPSGG